MDIRQRFHGWIGALVLSAFYLPAVAKNAETCAVDVQESPVESAFIEKAIVTLAGTPESEHARRNALFTQLKAAPENPAPAERALVDRMYIVLAASWLSGQQTDKAREVLRVIALDSPLAVTAAMLLAESWRMDGEPDKAVQWFLRIAAQQPENLDALNGLLAAAHTLAESGQPQLALTIYARIEQQAGAAATLVNNFVARNPASIASLMSGDNGLTTSLRKQAGQRLFQSAHGRLLAADRANRRSQQVRLCLTALIADYQQRIDAAERSIANLDVTLAAMARAHAQRQARITSLKSQIRANDSSNEQIEIRRAVRALMNQDLREQAQQQALEQNRDQLPVLVGRTRERLAILLAYYQRAEQSSGELITGTIREILVALATDFSDLAGQAALSKAHVQEELTSK